MMAKQDLDINKIACPECHTVYPDTMVYLRTTPCLVPFTCPVYSCETKGLWVVDSTYTYRFLNHTTNRVPSWAAGFVGLYDDSIDAARLGDHIGTITTEPHNHTYSRGKFDLPNIDVSHDLDQPTIGATEFTLPDVTLNVHEYERHVDSYFVTLRPDIDDHIMLRGSLDQTWDLSKVDTFTITGVGWECSPPD